MCKFSFLINTWLLAAPLFAFESLNANFINVSLNQSEIQGNQNANQDIINKFAKQYESSKSERRLYVRGYDIDLKKNFEKAIATKDPSQLSNVELAIRATLGDMVSNSPSNLADRITANGSSDQINFDMRDACLHFAMLFQVTGDSLHADRSAAILAKFALMIPTWPIWNPYSGAQAAKKREEQNNPNTFSEWSTAGIWGDWIYSDLIMATPLVAARALISNSGAIERLNASEPVTKLFELFIATQRKFSPDPQFSNMDYFQIRGFLDFGYLLPDPELIHEGVRHLDNLYRAGFRPDGWWHEGSSAYHYDQQRGLKEIAQEMLKGYSDPVGFQCKADGSRFDNLDLSLFVEKPSARADSVTKKLVLPDQTFLAIHDTQWPTLGPPYIPNEYSFLLGSSGQGTLVSGTGDTLAMATLHWGATSSHSHFDALNFNLWAKGVELISETQYQPRAGSKSTREWHTSTAAHVTVVVNGLDQGPKGKFGSNLREKQLRDAIPGVPDWQWRWISGSCANDSGDLRLFNTDFPEVQVIEADATKAYDKVAGVTMYRRTIALVRIDDNDVYVADIFRIKGANSYDYMLHSCLQRLQELKVSIPLKPMTGSLFGYLNNLQSATTDAEWIALFKLGEELQLLTFMAPAKDTTIIQASGPSMRGIGDAPFVVARRNGDQTTFIAVHHPVVGSKSRVRGIELLPTDCETSIALRVNLDNRTDTIFSSVDRADICATKDGMQCRALFAHVATSASAAQNWAYMVDGDLLRTPHGTIEGEVSYQGTVTATTSTERGDSGNGFVVAEQLPMGRSLMGSAVIVDQAGEMSWSYRAGTVVAHSGGNGSTIETPDEPGFTVDANGIKQLYFPCWGFKGKATYRIPGHATLRPSNAGAFEMEQTGNAKFSASSNDAVGDTKKK
jgi:hypothetical protein